MKTPLVKTVDGLKLVWRMSDLLSLQDAVSRQSAHGDDLAVKRAELMDDLGALTEELRLATEYAALVTSRVVRLGAALTEVQTRCGELLAEKRATLRVQVREFFVIAEQVLGEAPKELDDHGTRFRCALGAEEVFEVLEASFAGDRRLADMKAKLLYFIWHEGTVDVDLPDLVDALADTDYVIEGYRAALGVDVGPHAALVHDKNMQKRGGPKDAVTGKHGKPPGWTPPDHVPLLREAGWKGLRRRETKTP